MVWTGYVLLLDAVVARLTGRSYLTTARDEGVLVVLTSIVVRGQVVRTPAPAVI